MNFEQQRADVIRTERRWGALFPSFFAPPHRPQAIRGRWAALLVVLICGMLFGCGQRQFSTSDSVRRELESLYTAVNSPSRPELLEQSAKRLTELRDRGEIDSGGHTILMEIVDQAKRGKSDREKSAQRLYDLMRGQAAPR